MEAIWALVGAVLGAAITGYFQLQAAEKQSLQQLQLLERQFAHAVDTDERQYQRELQQKEEANNQLIKSYIFLLIPMLRELAEISYLPRENEIYQNEIYQRMKKGIYDVGNKIDPVNPQENRGYQMTFLIFQFIAAYKIALSSRFSRAITMEQKSFLDQWEDKFEQIFCSPKYPGKPWFYRERIDVIAEEMLTVSTKTGLLRPMNWKEFVEKIFADDVFKALVEGLRNQFSFVFDISLLLRLR